MLLLSVYHSAFRPFCAVRVDTVSEEAIVAASIVDEGEHDKRTGLFGNLKFVKLRLIIFKEYFGCNRRRLLDAIDQASDEDLERFVVSIYDRADDRVSHESEDQSSFEGSSSGILDDDEDFSQLGSVAVIIGSDLDYPSNYGSGESEYGKCVTHTAQIIIEAHFKIERQYK